MENVYLLSDAEIIRMISAKLKEFRLAQNISRQAMSVSTGVSMSSVVRMEEGEIKSFESLLRVMRMLGKLDVFNSLLQEEEISPNEYFKWVQAGKPKQRKRASKSNNNQPQEESEW